jgi:hypothetical protein
VYEKVSTNGCGAVSLFASAPGTYTYVTNATDVSPKHWHNEGVAVALDEHGRARITARFETGGAKIVLFGVQQP